MRLAKFDTKLFETIQAYVYFLKLLIFKRNLKNGKTIVYVTKNNKMTHW